MYLNLFFIIKSPSKNILISYIPWEYGKVFTVYISCIFLDTYNNHINTPIIIFIYVYYYMCINKIFFNKMF